MGKILRYVWYFIFTVIVIVGAYFIIKEEQLMGYVPYSEADVLNEFGFESLEKIDDIILEFSDPITKAMTSGDFEFFYGKEVGGGFKLIGLHKNYSQNNKTYFLIKQRANETLALDQSEARNWGQNLANDKFAPSYVDTFYVDFYVNGKEVLTNNIVNYFENDLITKDAEEKGISADSLRQGMFHSMQGFEFIFDIKEYEKFNLYLEVI